MCTVLHWVQGWWSVTGLAIEIAGFSALSLDVAREYDRHRTVERYRAGAAAAQREVNAKSQSGDLTKQYKSFGVIGALDDFGFEIGEDFRQGLLEFRSLIAAVGKQLFQERIHPEQCRKKQNAAVAVLDIGRMNNRVQQQTQRIYENMALLALDLSATSSLSLFARIIAMRIDAGPPYMGRLKSSANFMVLPFFVPFVLAIGGDRPTPIDPHESGGGGRSLDLKTTKRHEAEPASS
jgi:hypothetical protein